MPKLKNYSFKEENNFITEIEPEEILEQLRNFVQDGDVILIKSSHGTGLWRLVEMMKGK